LLTRSIPFLISVILATAAWGQTPTNSVEKTFHINYVDTPQAGKEIAELMRSITAVQQASVDSVAKTLSLAGTADQIALASWILPQVDLPAGQPAPIRNPATLDYRVDGSSDDVARIFYLAPTDTPQAMQEIINAIRSMFEIQRITIVNSAKAIVARGTDDQIAATAWLIGTLDLPAGSKSQNLSYTFNFPKNPSPNLNPKLLEYLAANHAVRTFYVTNTIPQAMQEIINSIRSIVELQRVVAFTRAGAIVARGTPDQIAMAQWMIGALDKPAAATASPNPNPYPMAGSTEVARIFYLAPVSSEVLQGVVTKVRSTTNMQRVVSCGFPQAVVVRGSAGQVAMAEKLIQDRPL
jgi:hypothetical protein